MSQVVTLKADRGTMIQQSGRYKEIGYSVQRANFQEDTHLLCKSTWCTYVYLTEEQHEKFKGRINSAPWNGGQTYYRRLREEFVDVSSELKAKWEKPYYKIGDDFNHLWDNEREHEYDLPYMERHVKKVIDFLLAAPEAVDE